MSGKQKRKPKCKVPGCGRPANYARGVCVNCYKLLHRRVISGETTWEELAEAGLVTDQPKTPVAKAFKKLKS